MDVEPFSPSADPLAFPLRVGIAEGHTLFRLGLASYVESLNGFTNAWQAASASEATQQMRIDPPGILILDIALPGRHGIDFIKDVHAINPGVNVLVLSMYEEEFYVSLALKAGAKAYLTKRAPREALEASLRNVAAGRVQVSGKSFAGDPPREEKGRARRIPAGFAAFTDREAQIFDLIGAGKSNLHISENLGISMSTVFVHRMRLRKKLQLKGHIALTRYAIQWTESGVQGCEMENFPGLSPNDDPDEMAIEQMPALR